MLTAVVEMPDFTRRAKALMTEAERTALIDHLAANPEAGISLGGGLHKLRVARTGEGKSGGFRTIHFYRKGDAPLFLLTIFAKNEKANLSARDITGLLKLGEELALWYGRRT